MKMLPRLLAEDDLKGAIASRMGHVDNDAWGAHIKALEQRISGVEVKARKATPGVLASAGIRVIVQD